MLLIKASERDYQAEKGGANTNVGFSHKSRLKNILRNEEFKVQGAW